MNKVYHINEKINSIERKKLKRFKIKASTVAKLLLVGMLTREKSINQIMEKTHIRKKYNKIFSKNEIIPKMHGFRDGIKQLKSEQLKNINRDIIKKSKENKIYRNGTIDGLVVVGLDGVETFGSYNKDWDNSYKTRIKITKYNNGEKIIEEREYRKQINVFAKIVGKRPGLVLDYEKVTCNGNNGKQEYEPHVGIKIVNRLKESYGRGIDIIVVDAIYLRKNFLDSVKDNGYNAIVRLKGNNAALYNDVEGLFKLKQAKEFKIKRKIVNTNIHSERKVKSYSDIFEYKGHKIKAIKFEEEYIKNGKLQKDIIYVISTDLNIQEETVNKIIHARWDIENNGFNELKTYWNMKHCYISEENAIDVILEMIIMSYNIWEMYLYQHLHNFEKMEITKIGYIEELKEQLSKMSKEEIGLSSG